LTAFEPPPPTPTTFMRAKFSMSLRRGMGTLQTSSLLLPLP
jgi:hypothetical protein